MYAAVNSDCTGCGTCVAICEEVFRINSFNMAEAYTNPVPQDIEKKAKDAANICPVAAITLE
ncbi:MAG: ferredoxin [Bacillota bacterium]|nr:ferredoxin [Bacillota bacterium]MDP4159584.1 ferredoxin [Bacillota bacterium]